MHHNKKIDAPSGTALMFGRAAAEGRGIDLATHSARGRDGETGARKAGDIGFASLRGGTVVGEHSVIFAGPAERIELVHRAEDRMIFARGALHAAALGAQPEARALFDGRRAGAEGLLASSAAATCRSFPSAAASPSAPAWSARGRRAGRPRAWRRRRRRAAPAPDWWCARCAGRRLRGSRINSQLPWSAVTSSAPPDAGSRPRSCRARCRPPPPP